MRSLDDWMKSIDPKSEHCRLSSDTAAHGNSCRLAAYSDPGDAPGSLGQIVPEGIGTGPSAAMLVNAFCVSFHITFPNPRMSENVGGSSFQKPSLVMVSRSTDIIAAYVRAGLCSALASVEIASTASAFVVSNRSCSSSLLIIQNPVPNMMPCIPQSITTPSSRYDRFPPI